MNCLILILSIQLCTLFTASHNFFTAAQTSDKQFRVLLWNKYFGTEWPTTYKTNCSYKNCELTSNRSLMDTSDAVLFHWRDIDVNDLPRVHRHNQTWILYNLESPIQKFNLKETIKPIEDQINWTMTYRYDSDIYAPYGQIVRCNNSGHNTNNVLSGKTKNAAWVVSNCKTHSNREKYARELNKYIDVDIYGKCGLECSRKPSCFDRIYREYKFYLSFENSICKDYVTEKLFNAAKNDIIPIVLGGADYKAIMPANSYIDVFNFSSPKQLAEYLHSVGSDPIKYDSYMSWKQRYCIVETDMIDAHFCDMCEHLNNPKYPTKTISFTDWWFRGGNCKSDAQTLYRFSIVFSFYKYCLIFFIIVYLNL